MSTRLETGSSSPHLKRTARRLSAYFTGQIAVRDPGAGVNVSAPIFFRRITNDGEGARGSVKWFTFAPPFAFRPYRIDWNIQDLG